MADSEMGRRGDSLEYGKSDPKAKWNYQTGLFLKALLAVWEETGQQKYYDYVKQVIDSYVEADGTIRTYKLEDYNLDKINSGKVLLSLYRVTGEDRYSKAAMTLRLQLDNQPRTMEGGFWHKQRYPWQMWLDGIYMGAPFYAEFSLLFDRLEDLDDVVHQILVIDGHTRNRETGLRYHAWDESRKQRWANPDNGCSPHFWGRAMGWYSMALVDVLDFLPTDHPRRGQVLYILRDVVKAVSRYQDQGSGLWYQVLDQGTRRGNYLEASASSMFVYAIAKGVRKGYLESRYWQVAMRGYQGLLERLVEFESDDSISLTQVCSVAGLGGDPYRDGSFEYYIGEPVVKNDLKGVGPFILAGLEIEHPPAVGLAE
ncbi:MAG: glycoside hydrolase family 88 protein [Fidelibacterota bacterium]|nr:MAG: glycoside hydrolase family 88 protein [Candidatus Neomarinimicrobiota bacterium]